MKNFILITLFAALIISMSPTNSQTITKTTCVTQYQCLNKKDENIIEIQIHNQNVIHNNKIGDMDKTRVMEIIPIKISTSNCIINQSPSNQVLVDKTNYIL